MNETQVEAVISRCSCLERRSFRWPRANCATRRTPLKACSGAARCTTARSAGAFKNALDWFQLLSDRNPPYLTDKVVGLISTAGGTHGLQAVNTMEFAVRALRGWAVPLVLPIPQAWQAFKDGKVADARVEEQLRALGRELARAAQLFGTSTVTTPDASKAEAQVEPLREEASGTTGVH
jgi:hypothetical protein